MIDWQNIDTVLLDMDGTLLDLHYDNHLWNHIVPQEYAKVNQLNLSQAKIALEQKYNQVEDSLSWYCYDFWTHTLGLDIYQIQHLNSDKIAWRKDALWFLQQLGSMNKRRVLLTNAHPEGVRVKNEKTQLCGYLDDVISTHSFGQPKEEQSLWQQVQQALGFDPARTLFIDDNELILQAAQTFGIAHLIAINTPDSSLVAKSFQHFASIDEFQALINPANNNDK
ncbi:GMP/IMP nucleotidase [Motilimonas pumila]|uniref:GMP/IMP nucleotidase n=1 Tax=Motilimonas pumila TaxID=2303987 RepID=A0A418YKV9_9GAMM|nr:GMP/IMP nucleotidase [Motilimonas pumila]RJG51611.1 GMP/IMP nucleotidase [Motilimonas pumila]